jgi:hypothetical protein
VRGEVGKVVSLCVCVPLVSVQSPVLHATAALDGADDPSAAVHLLLGVLNVPVGVVDLLLIFIQTVPRASLIKTRTAFFGSFVLE